MIEGDTDNDSVGDSMKEEVVEGVSGTLSVDSGLGSVDIVTGSKLRSGELERLELTDTEPVTEK